MTPYFPFQSPAHTATNALPKTELIGPFLAYFQLSVFPGSLSKHFHHKIIRMLVSLVIANVTLIETSASSGIYKLALSRPIVEQTPLVPESVPCNM